MSPAQPILSETRTYTGDGAGEASGAPHLDASKRRFRVSKDAIPSTVQRELNRAQLTALFEPPGLIQTNFPPFDHPDVDLMLSRAAATYAQGFTMLYTGPTLYQSWALEWPALVENMLCREGARWMRVENLTSEVLDALILMSHAKWGRDLPVWQRIIRLLDMVNGRTPTLPGYAMIRPLDDTHWRPALDGERQRACLVIPVWVGAHRFGPRYDRSINCVELVAVDPAVPDRWRVRTGDVPILGDLADLDEAYRLHLPIRLFRAPYGWLKAGGMRSNGYCVLDWDSFEAKWLLEDAYSLVAEDDEHARALQRRIKAAVPRHRPKLFVDDREASA